MAGSGRVLLKQVRQLTGKADRLTENYARKQELAQDDPLVRQFAATMHQAVANYTESASFMEYEERILQQKLWGTTGPEKG